MKYIAGDGNNETRKNHVLNNFFAIDYNMVYGNVRDVDVTVKTRAGHMSRIKVSGVSAKILDRTAPSDRPVKPLTFVLRKNEVAVLTIRTFDSATLQRAGVSYRQLLNETFQKMQRSAPRALIIDVRGNGGGRDLYGSLLYAYIAREPFMYYQSLTAATPNLPFEQFSRDVSSYNGLSRDMLDSCKYPFSQTAFSW